MIALADIVVIVGIICLLWYIRKHDKFNSTYQNDRCYFYIQILWLTKAVSNPSVVMAVYSNCAVPSYTVVIAQGDTLI
jgi:hypothetical protein